MPNGGSDCCGECSHFRPSHEHGGWCQIRDLFISVPFWTYCGNQTRRDGCVIPIGSVYVDDPRPKEKEEVGWRYTRVAWRANTDTVEVRDSMLAALDAGACTDSTGERLVDDDRIPEIVKTLVEWRDERVLVRLASMLRSTRGQGVLPPTVASRFIEEIGPYPSLEALRDAREVLGAKSAPGQKRIADYLDLLIKHTEAHAEAVAQREAPDTAPA